MSKLSDKPGRGTVISLKKFYSQSDSHVMDSFTKDRRTEVKKIKVVKILTPALISVYNLTTGSG